jgi:hypothetical protein
MARTAVTQLEQQIEEVRRQAFAAGYTAAMKAVREAASRSAPASSGAAAAPRRGRGRGRGRPPQTAAAAPRSRPGRAPTAGRPTTTRRTAGRRPERGTNARMIEEILQQAAPGALRPAEIRKALQDKGVSIAFTSIRHSLGQLEARHAAEQVGDSNTWRHRGDAA